MTLVVTDQMAVEVGTAALDGRFSGPITLVLRGEDYYGTFSAVRSQARIPPFGGWFVTDSAATDGGQAADTGVALAYVRSASGKSLGCGFRYSIGGLSIVPSAGIGRCRDETGTEYDVRATTR